eukprot:15358375-Ditylum_brightwellii.AAC.1
MSNLSLTIMTAFQLQPLQSHTVSTASFSSSYDYNYADTSPLIQTEENTYCRIDSLTQQAKEVRVQKAPSFKLIPSFFNFEYKVDSDYKAMTTEDLTIHSNVLFVLQYLILSSNAAMNKLRT